MSQQMNNPMLYDDREIKLIKEITAKTGFNPVVIKDLDYAIFLQMQNNQKEVFVKKYKEEIADIMIHYDIKNPIIKDLIENESKKVKAYIDQQEHEIGINNKLMNIIELKGMNQIANTSTPEIQADMLKEHTTEIVDFDKITKEMLAFKKR
jgi:hypothetical protein